MPAGDGGIGGVVLVLLTQMSGGGQGGLMMIAWNTNTQT